MNKQSLKHFFPAGGIAHEKIQINEIKSTNRVDVLIGSAVLPLNDAEQKIVIYSVTLEDATEDLRAISASCPHQGADISGDELKPDGNVYCSLHRRPICIYSKYNQAYAVTKSEGEYFILKTQ